MYTLNNATIVDVRSRGEYEGGHYPGAVNIPVDQLQQRLDELNAMPKPIVAYCRSGARSNMAVSILKQNGIREVYNGGALDDLLQVD